MLSAAKGFAVYFFVSLVTAQAFVITIGVQSQAHAERMSTNALLQSFPKFANLLYFKPLKSFDDSIEAPEKASVEESQRAVIEAYAFIKKNSKKPAKRNEDKNNEESNDSPPLPKKKRYVPI